MKIHKEGYNSIVLALIVLSLVNVLFFYFFKNTFVLVSILTISVLLFLIILYFFRLPTYTHKDLDPLIILSPAEGKVVAIEEVFEPEFYNQTRLQISIFMSPLNVHVNRYPISGQVAYSKYHPGKYLVAWHPKSSTENERTTMVIEHDNGQSILVRQIAGALARRIVCYAKTSTNILRGNELGFIKFGSRVDLYVPLGSQIDVKIGDTVKGGISQIGKLN